MLVRTFGVSVLLTAAGLVAALLYDGPKALFVTAILVVLEVSLSFDNAVVNARVLERMSAYWQRLFLTVGMVVAVFGMRLVFPLLVVGVTAHLSPWRAWRLALERGDPDTPGSYGYLLHDAHPAIAAFGGIFLLMIFLDFLIDEHKQLHWLDPVERLIQRAGLLRWASELIALVALVGFTLVYRHHTVEVLVSGVAGLASYLLVNGAAHRFQGSGENGGAAGAVVATGKAAFWLFVYLQVLDASFSFDGVIGAFAITSDPVVIALGLGIGALYVRSLTVLLVRRGTLGRLVFLEHGAHWAIGALAVLLLVSIEHEVPEVVTGLIGVGFIGAALVSSLRRNRLHPA
ncbi:DUF475 domain-containing protein [Nocardioides sp.]|jgi:hypothetical protein|uniref:DUF475 domain-containing protein n=1 Tax=Nocardioides sp. TaxID=35761 RepID=UPI002D0F8D82|nr:DUF475 domain-containing protein [Nocardioides sp.]HVX53164.1 DUF475 domain-containing protein [Nocardioides sp.]